MFDGIGLPAGEPVRLEAGTGDPEVLPGRSFSPPGGSSRRTVDTSRGFTRRCGAWTPTLTAYGPPDPNDTPERLERPRSRSERMTTMLPLARRYGVHVLTGSDMVGTVAGEIDQLVKHGLTVTQALEAATTSASEFLGLTGNDDLVTYDADPRDHPEVLASPTSVVLWGQRIC